MLNYKSLIKIVTKYDKKLAFSKMTQQTKIFCENFHF